MTQPQPNAPTPSRVPRLCPGGTVVCLGGGPSLTREDVDYCRGRATVIAINNAHELAPWADALIASDADWWRFHKGVPSFAGLKYCVTHPRNHLPIALDAGIVMLRGTGDTGLELSPSGIRTGCHTGAAAINLAVHFGAARVLLLGYDGQRTGGEEHWFGVHPPKLRRWSNYDLFADRLARLVDPLARAGVTVINCSRQTAYTCFPRQPLTEALP